MSGVATPLFRSVDRAVFVAALAARLHQVGLHPPLASTGRFAAALEVAAPRSRGELYWVARTCLLDDVSQIERFDRVFAAVFDWASSSLSPPERARGSGPRQRPPDDGDAEVRVASPSAREAGGGAVPWTTMPSAGEPDDDLDDGTVLPELLPSALAVLADVPFDELDDEQLAAVGAVLENAVLRWPRRLARRRRRSPRRRTVDQRATMRMAMRTAGEPLRLAHTRRIDRPRRVVMIADVSGSMQSYARAYLHLMRALSRVADAETFAFSTGLTRLTATLAHRDPRAAIALATAEVDDRFSGTRIATSLRQLLHHPVWSTAVRGAVVIIASDGWDTDPPAELEARMRRLHRMAHRVVWVNPRSATPGFEPAVSGMAAALPYCDAMVSGHSLSALRELFAVIAQP